LSGDVSRDGIVTIYAVTSTISASGDQGADPNRLVKVLDRLDATTVPTGAHDSDHDRLGRFEIIRSAKSGEVFRGVAWAPEDEDSDSRTQSHKV